MNNQVLRIVFALVLLSQFSDADDWSWRWGEAGFKRCEKMIPKIKPDAPKSFCHKFQEVVIDGFDDLGMYMANSISLASVTDILSRAETEPFKTAGENAIGGFLSAYVKHGRFKKDELSNLFREKMMSWLLKVVVGDSSGLGSIDLSQYNLPNGFPQAAKDEL